MVTPIEYMQPISMLKMIYFGRYIRQSLCK